MKKLILTSLFFGSLLFSDAQVVVKIKPTPPAKKVHHKVKAKKGHVWVDGHWQWSPKAKKYVWIKGKWVVAKKGHIWVSGHWVNAPGGFKWIPGHWKKK